MTELNLKVTLASGKGNRIRPRNAWLFLSLVTSALVAHAGKMELPAGVTQIGTMAFAQCLALEEASIPASVIEIGASAFSGASALERATFRGNAPVMGTRVFDDTEQNFVVHYTSTAVGFSTPQWMGYPAYPHASPALQILQIGNRNVQVGTTIQFMIGTNAPEEAELELSAQGSL